METKVCQGCWAVREVWTDGGQAASRVVRSPNVGRGYRQYRVVRMQNRTDSKQVRRSTPYCYRLKIPALSYRVDRAQDRTARYDIACRAYRNFHQDHRAM